MVVMPVMVVQEKLGEVLVALELLQHSVWEVRLPVRLLVV
jgi:hypothetical protein